MNPILRRTLVAYRPLYLHGLLLDGQYRLPRVDQPADPATSVGRTRQRSLLAALTQIVFRQQGKS